MRPVEFPDGSECGEVEYVDPDTNGLGIWLRGLDWDDCVEFTIDADEDGMNDICESTLAYTFALELIMAPDCNWDLSLDRMGGEYFYAAQIMDGVVRIAYLPDAAAQVALGAITETTKAR